MAGKLSRAESSRRYALLGALVRHRGGLPDLNKCGRARYPDSSARCASAQQFQGFRQLGEQLRAECCANVEKRGTRNGIAAIFPGMVRATLHYNLALSENHLAVIEQQHQFALDDHDVVQRLGAMLRLAPPASLERVNIEYAQQVTRDRHDREVALIRFAILDRGQLGD